MRAFFDTLIFKMRLRLRNGRVVAFDLPSMGELQFIGPVLTRFTERNPETTILVVHNRETIEAFQTVAPSLDGRVIHVRRSILNRAQFPEINLFLTSEQYDLGLDGVYSITMFHGHAAKGLSFAPDVINTFDALFLNGPVHREAFEMFVSEFLNGMVPSHLELFDIGYPKSDDLLKGCFASTDVLRQLSLDPSKKTILYAPAFNEGASLREYGIELIELLAQQPYYNVIIKLPIDCWEPTSNFYATGGMNWFEKIRELEARFPNLRLYADYQVDSLLACADVLITCISSVSFEFLALNRPVVFIDTPKYFSGYLKRRFPDKDTVSWANRTTVNGGKEFGLVVSDFRDLPAAIGTVLSHPDDYPKQQERLKHYLLYNRGRGTEAAVAKIEELLLKGAKSRRPSTKHGFLYTLVSVVLSRLFHDPLGRITQLGKRLILNFLNARGYTIQRTGLDYIDPEETVQAACSSKLSICDYLENRETDPRKKGRRDRIIIQMEKNNVFKSCDIVLEIGCRTGMYLEKVLEQFEPKRYEVYETHVGWANYLKNTYGANQHCKLIVHAADGKTLKDTPSSSCHLVHAHGVFVYLPILNTFSYLREAERVLVPGGHLVFDCYLDVSFSQSDLEAWLDGPWRFPVLLPESVLLEFTNRHGLALTDRFKEAHGSGSVDYLVFQKTFHPTTHCAPCSESIDMIEHITWDGQPLCYFVRASLNPEQTTFLTPPEFKQQVGYIVYPAGGEIARHVHRPLQRHLVGTSEVLIVKKGRCLIDIYNDDRELVATRELHPGYLMLMVGGGHGFRMLEDTVLLEIKQGPYTGVDEKERF